MNEANPTPSGGSPANETETEQVITWLRGLVQSLILAVFLLTGTMFIFIYRQVTIVRAQAAELGPVITDFRMNTQPVIDDLKTKLVPFAKANPDFMPLYLRYFGTNTPDGAVKK